MLNAKITLIVPTIQQNGNEIRNREKHLTALKKLFALNFGGYSTIEQVGGWILPNHQLQEEKSTLLYAYYDADSEDAQNAIESLIKNIFPDIKRTFNQDAIAYELECCLHFI